MVRGETSASVMAGLTMRNADTRYGAWDGAIRCVGASPCIRDCVFENNVALVGGGIYVEAASPVIPNCVFRGNRANEGCGLSFYYSSGAGTRVGNCTFVGSCGGPIFVNGGGTAIRGVSSLEPSGPAADRA